MKIFGLLGKNIDYSFSREYFKEKFENNKFDCTYKNFDLETIDAFIELKENCKDFSGFNVTIPYKEVILPYLDSIDVEAKEIGAVNTIKIVNNQLVGYNTDHYGFKKSHLMSFQKWLISIRFQADHLQTPQVSKQS